MATDKPLVSVYMPPELLDRLKAYQQDNDIKSASSAVVAALQEFFQMGTNAGYATIARVEELEERLNQLSDLVEELRHSPVRQQSSTPQRPQKRPTSATAPVEGESVDRAGEGLTLKELAAEISLNYTRLSATRQKMDDAEFLDYLGRKSAQAGRPRRWRYAPDIGKGRFFPVD